MHNEVGTCAEMLPKGLQILRPVQIEMFTG